MTGSGISYNVNNTDTGILVCTMSGMAAAVFVGSELLFGALLGVATDAIISLACGERDTNELLHYFADVLGDSNCYIDKYLNDANYIINNGTYTPELNGYVSFMSGKKYAKWDC